MFNRAAASAEEKLSEQINQFLIPLYEGHWLPSHNRAHHERVWQIAQKLAMQHSRDYDHNFYEALYLACHFHDTGLLYEKGPAHGLKSRNICESFLANYPDLLDFNPEELLHAIEHHDDKEYSIHNVTKVYQLLTMADDLDAFGAIGVYRYIEIYLLRRLNVSLIPNEILKNAAGRFTNLLTLSKKLKISIEPYVSAYDLLVELLATATFPEAPHSLVTCINAKVVEPENNPLIEFQKLHQQNLENARIKHFLKHFLKETKGQEF